MANIAQVGSTGVTHGPLVGLQANVIPKLLGILDSALTTSTPAQILQWLPAIAGSSLYS